MLLGSKEAKEFIPKGLLKLNKHGAYINGIWMVVILSGAIIVAQTVVPGAAAVLTQLNKLNSVCMPLRYLWVFFAYFMLRKVADEKFPRAYKFVKNQAIGKFFAILCFLIVLVFSVLGMYSPDGFTMFLNVVTPIVLTLLGLIFPVIRRKQDERDGTLDA